MHLEWSVFARADRKTIFDYIEADSPRAANAVDERIEAHIKSLLQFPILGALAGLTGHVNWLSTIRRTSRPIASLATQ